MLTVEDCSKCREKLMSVCDAVHALNNKLTVVSGGLSEARKDENLSEHHREFIGLALQAIDEYEIVVLRECQWIHRFVEDIEWNMKNRGAYRG